MKKKKCMFFSGLALSMLILSTSSLVGCSKKEELNNEEVKVTLVLDKGGVQDRSFNESAWNGAKQAAEELGVEVKYLESTTDADYTQNIETAMDMDSDLIIGIGFNLSQAIEDAANSYPDQRFAIIDGSFEDIPDNVTPILFNEKEAGYLAGLVAGKTIQSDSNKFGFVGGFEIPAVVNYRDGFEQGLKEANPNAILLTQYANSFTDAAKGRVIAEQMINKENVCCIVGSAGTVNSGVFEVCSENGIYGVGVDMAQNYTFPGTILTSAIKNVGTGVETTIKDLIENKFSGGEAVKFDLNNNGVGYEKTSLIPKNVIEFVDNKIQEN